MKVAGFRPGMAKGILSGSFGKAEGRMLGGYGKWNRDLVARAESAKKAAMTHPEKMKALRENKLMQSINNPASTPASRLGEFKWKKANGYL